MEFFRLGWWLRWSGLVVNRPDEHLPEIERDGDILAYCAKCGTRMFKTEGGVWKATSIYADTCQG